MGERSGQDRVDRVISGGLNLAGFIYSEAGRMAGAVRPAQPEEWPFGLVAPQKALDRVRELLDPDMSLNGLRAGLMEGGFIPVLVLVPEAHFEAGLNIPPEALEPWAFRLLMMVWAEAHQQLTSPEIEPPWSAVIMDQGIDPAGLLEEPVGSLSLEELGQEVWLRDLLTVLVLVPVAGVKGWAEKKQH